MSYHSGQEGKRYTGKKVERKRWKKKKSKTLAHKHTSQTSMRQLNSPLSRDTKK